jgi:2-keto-4-pentenoate hydratase/2-oxohepta-3-ene-1,7-dioic acid hydratase in catechol pathway
MRLGRIAYQGAVLAGVVSTDAVASAQECTGTLTVAVVEHLGQTSVSIGDVIDLADARLLAPIAPGKVIGIGKNYADHAAEMNGEVPTSLLMFLKPSSSVVGPGDAIELPDAARIVHHESELCVVIAERCRDVSKDDALSVVLGYTCGNDVSSRDLQKSDGQWTRAKGFDTFCPLGPWIETELDPTNVTVRCLVNGKITQDGNTSDMVYDVRTIIAEVSAVMTLMPGDVIMTGTPAGVGPILDGDDVTVECGGIGSLTNHVIRRK